MPPFTYVGRFCPFHCTTDPAAKFLPYTLNCPDELPVTRVVGERKSIAGTGLISGMLRVFEDPV